MRLGSRARCGWIVEKETLREAGLGMLGWDMTVVDGFAGI